MNYPTKKRRLISPLYLCYGNSFVYAADQLLFDISVASLLYPIANSGLPAL